METFFKMSTTNFVLKPYCVYLFVGGSIFLYSPNWPQIYDDPPVSSPKCQDEKPAPSGLAYAPFLKDIACSPTLKGKLYRSH